MALIFDHISNFSYTFTQTAAMLKTISNGVQTNLNSLRFRYFPLYSTAIKSSEDHPPHFINDCLEDSLLAAASKKVSRLKPPRSPELVINSFRNLGMSETHIKSIVSLNTGLISVTTETLAPKIRVFQDLGFSGSDLGAMFASNPSILTRRLDTHINPLVETLRSILGRDEDVVKAFKSSFMLISTSVQDRILPNLKLLKSYGLSDERIRKLVLSNPRNLICEPGKLESNLKFVEEKMGIGRHSKKFIGGIDAVSSCSKENIELKLRVFKSYGWKQSDITTMLRIMPCCLKVSESKIKSGLDFFQKELGCEPSYLATHPMLLLYSMENRVVPRRALWEALKEKKLIKTKCGLYTVMSLSNEIFMKNFVMPFEDELPEQCKACIKKPSN